MIKKYFKANVINPIIPATLQGRLASSSALASSSVPKVSVPKVSAPKVSIPKVSVERSSSVQSAVPSPKQSPLEKTRPKPKDEENITNYFV